MCRQIRCKKCDKPTWAGCGLHIEQTLANVPKDVRCVCREAEVKNSTKKRGWLGLWHQV